MIKKIDDGYCLNMPVNEILDLKELSLEEYKLFESMGIARVFREEKIYHGKDISFLEVVWNVVVGTTVERVYKITVQNISAKREESDKTFKKAYEYLFKEMGKHSEHDLSSKRYFWSSPDGNVILNQQFKMGVYGVEILLTSSILIKQQTEKCNQAYEVYKNCMGLLNPQKICLFIFPVIISVVMLFLAILLSHKPHNYYALVRFVVCGTSIYVFYSIQKLNKQGWAWAMLLAALLFNPVIPIPLHKITWRMIDFATALFFIIFLISNKELIKR